MFLLNNIHNKNYKKCYPTESDVIFDISEKQLGNVKNAAWKELREGSIVCVVTSTKKVSTFCKVTAIKGLGDNDPDCGETFLLFGVVIAKLMPESNMGLLLSKFSVKHQYLTNSKFSIGSNVVELGTVLDTLEVKTRRGIKSISELKASA
ncbi:MULTISPECIES: hypothetical protein [unclassified Moritella]|uniref:hypothetical protein n=1 Tax=unclassified Moritella TaxID=2637987 RepID=UPI001BA5BF78|nr:MULTISPECIES: hypothetical protein [unclassified Moritella]QUM81754.1 hypothetical protein HWV01_16400 [Moritella sp. 5]QUM86035.1 hypothetical protein HWV02_16720 [Moritella sp. 28]QUM90272.1 hypothetical protein HWV03_16435 [Moritella sp. 36]